MSLRASLELLQQSFTTVADGLLARPDDSFQLILEHSGPLPPARRRTFRMLLEQLYMPSDSGACFAPGEAPRHDMSGTKLWCFGDCVYEPYDWLQRTPAGFDGEDPQGGDYAPFTVRRYLATQESPVYEVLNGLFEKGGKLLRQLPAGIQEMLPVFANGHDSGSPPSTGVWLDSLFDVAITLPPGMASLRAIRYQPESRIYRTYSDHLPPFYFAVLEDPFMASSEFCRWLVQEMEQESKQSTEPLEVPAAVSAETTEPLANVLEQMTPQQGKLLQFLWNCKHAALWDSLPTTAFANGVLPSDDAIEKALKRLQDRLNGLYAELKLTLEISRAKRSVKLLRD